MKKYISRSARGFTLIGLLLVVASIAILSAMLPPVLARSVLSSPRDL